MKSKVREGCLGGLGLLLGCLVLFPLFYGVMGAFKSPAEFVAWPPTVFPRSFGYLKNFETVFTQLPMLRYFWNTLVVSVFSTVIKLVIALLAAYAFVYFDFAGKKALFFLLLGTMMLPPDTLTITNYQTVSHLGLLDTYLGIGIVSFVGASQMFMLRQHFLSSPKPLREAAQMDGCGDFRFIVFILTPMSLPLLLTLFLQAFVVQWNAYLWPLLVTNTNEMRTVQIGITMLTTLEGTNYETVLAGAAVALIPAVLLFLFLRKSITRTMSGGAIVG
ncbi:MAG: carbohydrate ABC transporter permease [Clostridia bacterium]|nr:carbohydrate ABC transporter permease [Clostridia bacterium]